MATLINAQAIFWRISVPEKDVSTFATDPLDRSRLVKTNYKLVSGR